MSNSSLEQDRFTLNQHIGLMNRAAKDLTSYLESHEDEIAIGINDFGELKSVFKKEFGRDAEWINPKTKMVFK